MKLTTQEGFEKVHTKTINAQDIGCGISWARQEFKEHPEVTSILAEDHDKIIVITRTNINNL